MLPPRPRPPPGNGIGIGRRGAIVHRRGRPVERRHAVAVDADRIDEHFGFTHDALHVRDARAAAGVVAVGNDHDGLLAVLPALRHRHRFGGRVIHRRAAVRVNASERHGETIAIVGPVGDEIRAGAEAIQEELVELVVHQAEEAIDRVHRRRPLLAGHAAAGVDDDAEADRRAIGAEVRHLNRLVVLVDEEVFLAQPAVEAARAIGDGGRHVDQLDAALELEAALVLPAFAAEGSYGVVST